MMQAIFTYSYRDLETYKPTNLHLNHEVICTLDKPICDILLYTRDFTKEEEEGVSPVVCVVQTYKKIPHKRHTYKHSKHHWLRAHYRFVLEEDGNIIPQSLYGDNTSMSTTEV